MPSTTPTALSDTVRGKGVPAWPIWELPAGHIPILDGWRGLAILMVMVHHTVSAEGQTSRMARAIHNVAHAGWCGVDLFFVLSGFLITGILLKARSSKHYFTNFYMRRVLRIFPLYYGVLAILTVILLVSHAPSILGVQNRWPVLAACWGYCVNLGVARSADNPFGVLEVFWSLAIEEQFYLVWPLLVFYLPIRWLTRVSLACIGISLLLRCALVISGVMPQHAPYFLTPCRLDPLAVGALLAILARSSPPLRRVRMTALIATLVTALSLFAVAFNNGWTLDHFNHVTMTAGYTLVAGFFGSAMLLSLTWPPTSVAYRVLTQGFFTFFGKYSYGLYVFHCIFVVVLNTFLPTSRLAHTFHSFAAGGLVKAGLVFASSIVAALLSWHLFEQPFLRLKRFFPTRTLARR